MKFLSTPIEYHEGYAVKREDLSCPALALSKMRGVYAHLLRRPERTVACLDTFRSWNGLCTALVCAELGKQAIVYYPEYKAQRKQLAPQQARALKVGAELVAVPAGRQFMMRHWIRKYREMLEERDIYDMPDGLRLEETIAAVAAEARRHRANFDTVVVPTGTGTHLRGIMSAFAGKRVIAVLGYTQSHHRLRNYAGNDFEIVDQGYDYRTWLLPDPEVPFNANPFYETKAWDWMRRNLKPSRRILFWNIGGETI